ncbi:hypothetical protein DSO57_1026349 [Entomophthora muscae]|uniref:Uncharacterized protein n=1 Tax=Entomophthora muscae TaxID=34485 RepID=A0ACC2RT32_9FUNG|nr:hypothetical protein DSO57_1026349 [Entomophthora muscae]
MIKIQVHIHMFLASFLPVVSTLENPTPTTDLYNSSLDDAHQKESLAHRWFKYPSSHWGRKFQYGCSFTPPPAKPALVRPYASFYLLTYVMRYYLLGWFSSMFRRFAYLGHLGHLAMVMVPIGLVIAGFNLGALAHQLGSLFPAKWVPDILKAPEVLSHYNGTLEQKILLGEESVRDFSPDYINYMGNIIVKTEEQTTNFSL